MKWAKLIKKIHFWDLPAESALRDISGKKAVKILCNKFEFQISGQSGSHVRLSKMTAEGKVGTV